MVERIQELIKLSLEHLRVQETRFQSLTQKVQQSMTIATSIAALIVAFNVPLQDDTHRRLIYAAFMSYGAVVFFYLLVVLPRKWGTYPIAPTATNLDKLANIQDDKEFHEWILGAFIGCYKHNQRLLDYLANLLSGLIFFMVLEVIFIILAKAIG